MELICLDIETTGLDNKTAEIIEIAAVKYKNGEIIEKFQTFVQYTKPIPPIIEHLTGITNEMTNTAPLLADLIQPVLDFCSNLPILGHNIIFDITFLNEKGINLTENPIIDTLPLSQILIQNTASHSLDVLSNKFNKTYFPTHRALDDCLANIEVFDYLLELLTASSPETTHYLQEILQKSETKWSKLLLPLLKTSSSKDLPSINFIPTPNLPEQPTSINTTTINFDSTLDQEDNSTLFVVSPATEKDIHRNFTKIPNLNSEISQSLFLEFINKPTLNESETIIALKIAYQLYTKTPLYLNDLTLGQTDYQYLPILIQSHYRIPSSQVPYLVNHHTFFQLLNKGLLPPFQKIYFENLTFIEETFIRASEERITYQSLSLQNQTLSNALLFRQLHEFASTIKTSDYGPVLLDNSHFTHPTFQNLLNTLENIEPSLSSAIQQLRRTFTSHLIWIHQHQDDLASISYLPKNIDLTFSLEEVAKQTQAENFLISDNITFSEPILLSIPKDLEDPNNQNYHFQAQNFIYSKLENLTSQALIISPTKFSIKHLHEKLAIPFADKGISLLSQDISGSKGKIMHNLENNEAPSILLCTQYFFLRNFPSLKHLTQLFILKFPMSLPNHPFYEYKKNNLGNSFMELLVPNTANVITDIINQAKVESSTLENIYLLDSRAIHKSWGSEILNKLPPNINIVLE